MAYIEAFGSYLPAKIVPNQVLARDLGCELDWIEQVSGIMTRRQASKDQDVVTLATLAAQDCLTRAGRKSTDVGLLVVASASYPRRFPGPACQVAQALGLDQTPALDVPVASAGSLVGMVLADALAATHGTVLVVAAEKMTSIAWRKPLDRNLAILFGDGAGACLINRDRGAARIADSVLHSDGSFADSLALDANGQMVMYGRAVIVQASRKLPRAISELLDRNQTPAESVGAFLLHQANQNLLDGAARALQVPTDRVFSNIRKYGNTSSASMLIAAAEWHAQSGFQAGVPVVFAAFGAGFHWGAMLAVGE